MRSKGINMRKYYPIIIIEYHPIIIIQYYPIITINDAADQNPAGPENVGVLTRASPRYQVGPVF